MGKRKVSFLDTFIDNVASLSLYIESKGLPHTAIQYKNKIYDFIEQLDFDLVEYSKCRDPERALLGLKCVIFNKKYTMVFYQFENEVIITEMIPSQNIYW